MYVYFTFLLDHSNILFFILFFVEIVLSRSCKPGQKVQNVDPRECVGFLRIVYMYFDNIKSGSPSSSSVMFWESGKVVRTAELHLTVNVGSNIDQRDFQPAVENGMQPI